MSKFYPSVIAWVAIATCSMIVVDTRPTLF